MRKAWVKSGVVFNIIIADEDFSVDDGYLVSLTDEDAVSIGYTHNTVTGEFYPNPDENTPPPLTEIELINQRLDTQDEVIEEILFEIIPNMGV